MKRPSKRGGFSSRVAASPPPSSVAKVSHTLEVSLAERLREFAFFERISESAIIEHALVRFLTSGRETTLGTVLRTSGAGKRRKT